MDSSELLDSEEGVQGWEVGGDGGFLNKEDVKLCSDIRW